MDHGWIEHYRVGGVSLGESRHRLVREDETLFVVLGPAHRIRLSAYRESGRLSVGIDAEWSDDQPGQLADYTPQDSCDCVPGEVTVSEDGLLTVMPRQSSAAHVVIRIGWTAQLPAEMFEATRRAIALAEAALQSAGAAA